MAPPSMIDQPTPAQVSLEKKYGMPIRDILIAELEAHRYQKNLYTKIAYRLDISLFTFKYWCTAHGIDPNEYRYASPEEAPPLPLTT